MEFQEIISKHQTLIQLYARAGVGHVMSQMSMSSWVVIKIEMSILQCVEY